MGTQNCGREEEKAREEEIPQISGHFEQLTAAGREPARKKAHSPAARSKEGWKIQAGPPKFPMY